LCSLCDGADDVAGLVVVSCLSVPAPSIQLLREDPDLAEEMSPEARELATEWVRVRTFRVPKGPWKPPAVDHAATGLVLLDGLMVRTLRLGRVSSYEVVGPTDIIRPWEDDLIPSLVPTSTDWRALEQARVGLLDGRTTELIGRWPELSAAIGSRLLRRSRSLAFLMAAQHFVRVEDRLLATLWHLASRWGRVTPQGTVVPFRLTHEMLASIIGAQRPTTTTAIHSLVRRERLARDERRHYVLLGEPPDWRKEPVPVIQQEV
jgi:CRP/FNR family transcriptional regulator, cyclic AMP receptor protein